MLEQILILLQIIFIDIILAADNAIIIGLIAANFAPKNRKQIILWGVAGALIFKIVFALFATYLFKFYFIKILGGLLLIWIVNDLRKDLFEIKKIKSPTKKSKEPSYIQSVYKVLFADITISFSHSDRCNGYLPCKLYSKTSMDCVCWTWLYLVSSNSTCDWRIGRLGHLVYQ